MPWFWLFKVLLFKPLFQTRLRFCMTTGLEKFCLMPVHALCFVSFSNRKGSMCEIWVYLLWKSHDCINNVTSNCPIIWALSPAVTSMQGVGCQISKSQRKLIILIFYYTGSDLSFLHINCGFIVILRSDLEYFLVQQKVTFGKVQSRLQV